MVIFHLLDLFSFTRALAFFLLTGGTRKELKVGALPTLNMPEEFQATTPSTPPPNLQTNSTCKEIKVGAPPTLNMPEEFQAITPSTPPPNLQTNSIPTPLELLLKTFSEECVSKSWTIKMFQSSGIILNKRMEAYDQHECTFGLKPDLSISLCYYGWKAYKSCYLCAEKISAQTITTFLKKVERSSVCGGLKLSSSPGINHLRTTSVDPFEEVILSPSVETLAKRYLFNQVSLICCLLNTCVDKALFENYLFLLVSNKQQNN